MTPVVLLAKINKIMRIYLDSIQSKQMWGGKQHYTTSIQPPGDAMQKIQRG